MSTRRVTFGKFRDAFFPSVHKKFKLDALVAWTQIKSYVAPIRESMWTESWGSTCRLLGPMWPDVDRNRYIKGSVEAVFATRALTHDEYLGLGEAHCWLNTKQHNAAYSIFEAYERYLHKI